MDSVLHEVTDIAIGFGLRDRSRYLPNAAIDQDLGINGDEGDEFVEALCAECGDWIAKWPWSRFVDFNEPPASLGPRIWRLLHLPGMKRAFPGYAEERLELGHIAAVIEKGQWFDP